RVFLVLARLGDAVSITELDDEGTPTGGAARVARAELPAEVARREREKPRWVWDDTERWYPALLDAGVRVERCVDLRLSHAILRNSELSRESALATSGHSDWDDLEPAASDDGG